MIDYHARQLTGSTCGKYNCAAASAASGIHAGTGGKVTLTSDTVRSLSKASCLPGVHSGSGGLYISDVIRVGGIYSVVFDYGFDPVSFYRRWTSAEARVRLSSGYGAVFLGDYDQLVAPYRASTTFQGDHSVWAHDLRADGSVCWHDPLRLGPIRVPFTVLVRYWQKPTSPIRGYAGWVKDTRIVAKPKVRVRALTRFWRYFQVSGRWTRTAHITPGGFTADCTAPQTLPVMGLNRRLVKLTSGAYSQGSWNPTYLDIAAFGITYREE